MLATGARLKEIVEVRDEVLSAVFASFSALRTCAVSVYPVPKAALGGNVTCSDFEPVALTASVPRSHVTTLPITVQVAVQLFAT